MTDLEQAAEHSAPFMERIDARNDPSRVLLSLDLVSVFGDAALPSEGVAVKIPYPANWWALRNDGINRRWDGNNFSPAEKYDLAFRGWSPAADFASLRPFRAPGQSYDEAYYAQLGPAGSAEARYSGNWRARNGVDDDGDGEIDEAADWDGLEGWWGHCNGWAAAAIMVNEPLHPVVDRGVRFEISDIKALLTDQWYSTPSGFLATRCNRRPQDSDPAHADDSSYYWSTDENGRVVESECRDTNAASLYLVATNLIGRHGRAFVIDSNFDWQVWNWPVYSYRIQQQRRVDKAEAIRLLGESGDDYKYNADAVAFAYVDMSIQYVSDGINPHKQPVGHKVERYSHTDRYTMVLELDASDRIIGGEWAGDSKTNHPDFIWVPSASRPNGSNTGVRYDDVESLLTRSRSGLGETTAVAVIPPRDANGVQLTVQVRDAEAGSNRLQVFVDIDHSQGSQLVLDLVAPDGRSTRLKRGGSSVYGGLVGWFPYDLTPAEGLDALASAGNGTWTLRVANATGTGSGQVRRFSVALWSDGQAAADRDGDGDPDTTDCAPDDASVHHAATELCGDGVDNDCQGGDASCDDHGDDFASATAVTPGPRIEAQIERGGDVDMFTFTALAGRDYVFQTSLLGLSDTTLTLFGEGRTQIAFNDDDGQSYASRIAWSCAAQQKVYLQVAAYSASQTGRYGLAITESGGTTPPADRDGDGDPDATDCAPDSAAVHHGATEICSDGLDNDCAGGDAACDDHANTPAGATALAPGQQLAGSIERGGDVDLFVVAARAGVSYTAATALGTLGDTTLEALASDGSTRLAFNDDAGGTYASQLVFSVQTDGPVYLRARAYGATQIGTYTLRLSASGGTPPPPPAGDDHGNDAASATAVASPSTTAARLEAQGDVDVFALQVVQGRAVTVRTLLGDLRDTVLQLRGADGSTVLAENDDADGGLASRILYTPAASGTVYAVVRAYSSSMTGSYQLQVE
ncbi:MAG: MopE-related protein [Pseudomonadota bacterium]